jgi:hypothetical protein
LEPLGSFEITTYEQHQVPSNLRYYLHLHLYQELVQSDFLIKDCIDLPKLKSYSYCSIGFIEELNINPYSYLPAVKD